MKWPVTLRLACLTLVCAMVSLSFAEEKAPLRLVVNLTDDSCIMGTSTLETVSLQTASHGQVDVRLRTVALIEFGKDEGTAKVTLLEGDQLTGTLSLKTLELETIFGSMSIPTEHVRSVIARPAPVLPEDGADNITGGQEPGQDIGATILSRLRVFDSLLLDDMTIDTYVVHPRSIRFTIDSEREAKNLRLTIKDGVWVSKAVLDENVPPPKYQEGRRRSDYTRSGGLRVSRRAQHVTLYEPDFRGLHTISVYYVVSPDGEVSQSTGAPFVELHDPVRELESGDVYIPVLSAGRGYSKLLTEITEVLEQDDGLIRCKGVGRYPGDPPNDTFSDWELLVDPDAAYMVRWAKCVYRKHGSVTAVLENEGTKWFERGPLPEKARFTFDPDNYGESPEGAWLVTFNDMATHADQELIATARKLLRGKFAKGTRVYDRRKGAKVPRYTVGEDAEE